MQKETRRDFVKKTVLAGSAASLGFISLNAENKEVFKPENVGEEWRNKQEGMEYRKLGRTGLMVSAMVIGGGRLNPKRYKYVAPAIERGVNYIDTAWRYGNGNSELGTGEVIKMAGREKLFICTKISPYLPAIDEFCMDIYKALPSHKQNELVKKATDLIDYRGVRKPGYYYKFFPPQDSEFPEGYLTYIIRQEYGAMRQWKSKIKSLMHQSIDESLERLGTDYIDILMCPHGARLPEEFDDPAMKEVFEEEKQQGKVRFSGVSIHTDVPANLEKVAEVGYYDSAMIAYNIVNHGSIDLPLRKAYEKGLGIIAMKAASGVNSQHPELKPPQWRIDKLNKAIPGDMKIPVKAYLWVHQNPMVAGMISDFQNEEMIHENLQIIGKRVEIQKL